MGVENIMNIAVLSGKGGTGKTTVSTNLASALKLNYVDSDVEEPNGFLFLNPEIEERKKVMVEYPIIDKDKCTLCGECARVCQFNSLAKVKDKIMLFQNLCHSCGACEVACKYGAITYGERETGLIEIGKTENGYCSRGILNIGEPMAVTVIKNILKEVEGKDNLIDCPPGTSCNIVNVLKYADAAILVTEPSQFGFHDLAIAVEVVRMFKIPFGIIINKDDGKDNMIRKYCKKENIELIGSIPYRRDIAQAYSKGETLYNNSKFKSIFEELASRTKEVLKWN